MSIKFKIDAWQLKLLAGAVVGSDSEFFLLKETQKGRYRETMHTNYKVIHYLHFCISIYYSRVQSDALELALEWKLKNTVVYFSIEWNVMWNRIELNGWRD